MIYIITKHLHEENEKHFYNNVKNQMNKNTSVDKDL